VTLGQSSVHPDAARLDPSSLTTQSRSFFTIDQFAHPLTGVFDVPRFNTVTFPGANVLLRCTNGGPAEIICFFFSVPPTRLAPDQLDADVTILSTPPASDYFDHP